MGGFYQSIQVPRVDRDEVRAAIAAFQALPGNANLRAYLGEPVDGWIGVYTEFSPETDVLARFLSQRFDRLVLTIASLDEDELLCNFCLGGKDLGFFKIATGTRRSGKRLEPVARRLELLAPYCDAVHRQELLSLLADTRGTAFSSEILRDFSRLLGIRNAMLSYTYIAQDDYAGDMDVPVNFERLGPTIAS